MDRTAITTGLATAGLALVLTAAPAVAGDDGKAKSSSQTSEQSRDRAEARDENRRDVGDTLSDAWLVTKVKAQFWDEDALDDSDIDVDAREGVIILRGTVASQAGKARAAQIARDTEGVKRVDDRLSVGVASRDRDDDAVATTGAKAREEATEAKRESREMAKDARDEAKEVRDEAREHAKDAREEAREESKDVRDTAREAGDDSREAVGTAGEAVTDGWITTKVKGSFVGEDALDGSDIDVDTNDGVVTLSGTVASETGRARAIAVAKEIDGVKSVKDELKIVRNE